MTYLGKEESLEDGQPIELYLFSNKEETFAYTSGPDPVVFGLNTYQPLAISRTDPNLEDVTTARNLGVKVPITEPFARRYLNFVPASLDTCIVYRQHSTDGGAPETIQFFTGEVTNVTFKKNEATINVQNVGAILERLVPQQTCRNGCNHILYDTKCAVTENSFRITTTVTGISSDGLTITVDADTNTFPSTGLQLSAQLSADSDFLLGGLLERDGGNENRMVRATADQTGDIIECTIIFPFQTLALGTQLQLFAGCDHQFSTCTDKFSNTERYGGFPFIPLKNPFTIGVKG